MDTAFSYDYSRLVLGKQIIQATFSNSEKLPQNHYKQQPQFYYGRLKKALVTNRDVEADIFQQLPLPYLSLPLPLTKNEKTTVDNFFNFCGSVACLLLYFIILRKQKPSYIAITLPTSLELIVLNYSEFLFHRY